jgi:hypothetical protein
MNFKIEIESVIIDPKKGRSVLYKREVAHSLLKQFIQLLGVQMSNAYLDIKTTDGSMETHFTEAVAFRVAAVAGVTSGGIVIGIGAAAVDIDDYKLGSQVITDVAHGLVSFAYSSPSGSSRRFIITRSFTNNTGAKIDITEAGLYGRIYDNRPVCLDRSLYSFEFNNGAQVTLAYYLTIEI